MLAQYHEFLRRSLPPRAPLLSPTLLHYHVRQHSQRFLTAATLTQLKAEHLRPKTFQRLPNLQVGYIYFDSLFPIKFGFWDLRSLFVRTDHKVLLQQLKNKMPAKEAVGHDLEVIGAKERYTEAQSVATSPRPGSHRGCIVLMHPLVDLKMGGTFPSFT